MSPFGIIDFVDNPTLNLQSQAQAHPGVVGGPPAYLEAHGIRYVPCASLEASAGECCDHPEAQGLVPMSRDATSAASLPVSKRELDSRVDDRIRKFMQDADYRGVSSRMHYDEPSSDLRGVSSRMHYDEPSSDLREKLRALRSDLAAEERSDRGLRSELADKHLRRSDRVLRSSAGRSREDDELMELRLKTEAAARKAERALSRRVGAQRLADL